MANKISIFNIDVGSGNPVELALGRGNVIPIINEKSCEAKNIDIHQVVLKPGVKAGRIHYHKGVENVYIILKGTGEILTGSETIKGKAGDVIFIPPGVPHEPRNTGETELRLIEIKTPPQAKDDFVVVETL